MAQLRKRYKILIVIFIAVIVLAFVLYADYYDAVNLSEEELNEGKNFGGVILKVSESPDLKSSANPALRFRNKSTGDVSYYFDHEGKLWASNITTKNLTSRDGFFIYLGNQASRITKGWFTDLYADMINATRINTTEIFSTDWSNASITESQIIDLDDSDTNVSTACGDNEVMMGNDEIALCIDLNATIDARATGLGDNSSFNESYTNILYVPYTGATKPVNLGGNNFTVDTNVLYVDADNNRVGVGVSDPIRTFHIYDTDIPFRAQRHTTASTNQIFTGQEFMRSCDGTAENTIGIGLLFSAQDNAGEDTYAAMIGGGLANVTDGAEVGSIFLMPSYLGQAPGTRTDVELRATGSVNGESVFIVRGSQMIANNDAEFQLISLGGARTPHLDLIRGTSSVYGADGYADFRFLNSAGKFYLISNVSSTATNVLTIDGSTKYVGIQDITPSYPLEVNADVSDISIYASKNISATGYITRTSVFDKSKNPFDFIKDTDYYLSDGKIDHKKFYGYINWSIPDTSRPVFGENETVYYPYNRTEEGVSLDAEVNVLRQAVYELKQENLLLKNCIINSKSFFELQGCIR